MESTVAFVNLGYIINFVASAMTTSFIFGLSLLQIISIITLFSLVLRVILGR